MARQNVRYAEVTFTPSTHYLRLGVSHDTYFGGLTRGRQRARTDFGVEINWVFDIVHMQPSLDHENDGHRLAGRHVTRRLRRSGRPCTEGGAHRPREPRRQSLTAV
jgi:hypothetical protein